MTLPPSGLTPKNSAKTSCPALTGDGIGTTMRTLCLPLKTFGASTFFSNFCRPLTWEQLEAREGTLGVSYSPDLLDLFFAFLSYHGTLPLPFFRATPDALEKVLLQGCYRPPGALAGLFHISQEPHETPANFYTRAFLLPLRFPCLTTLGLPPPDIFAIESAVRQELLRVPLPQALDFLHSQILAILCVNAPRRPKGSQKIHSIDPCPPTACYLVFPERATAGVPDPPQFRCWISRRVAPNMAVIGLKCNSTPWACSYVDGTSGNLFVGFTPGNFLQLAFPTDDERFPPQKGSNASHFAFALYITSTSGNKGRVGEELPTEQKDTGPTYVTAINGILLPFLLRHKLRPAPSSSAATSTLFQIGLPLFPREDSLAEALELPPLSMEHSFYMPVSAIRGLFSQLLTVPLYRQPNTLGWPYLDAPIDPGDQCGLQTLFSLSAISSCSFLISCPLLFKNFYKLFRSTVHTSTISPPSPTSGKRASFRAPDLMTCPRSTIGPLNGNPGHRWIALSSPRSKVRMLKIGSCSASLEGTSSGA